MSESYDIILHSGGNPEKVRVDLDELMTKAELFFKNVTFEGSCNYTVEFMTSSVKVTVDNRSAVGEIKALNLKDTVSFRGFKFKELEIVLFIEDTFFYVKLHKKSFGFLKEFFCDECNKEEI